MLFSGFLRLKMRGSNADDQLIGLGIEVYSCIVVLDSFLSPEFCTAIIYGHVTLLVCIVWTCGEFTSEFFTATDYIWNMICNIILPVIMFYKIIFIGVLTAIGVHFFPYYLWYSTFSIVADIQRYSSSILWSLVSYFINRKLVG